MLKNTSKHVRLERAITLGFADSGLGIGAYQHENVTLTGASAFHNEMFLSESTWILVLPFCV